MIAYNKNWLDSLLIQKQTAKALTGGYITAEENSQVKNTYNESFFTPNFFIRIGLFVLTIVIAVFSSGLVTMVVLSISESVTALSIFFGLLAYGALEFMVNTKNHYKSGVDDALIWMSSGMLFGGISFGLDASALTMCLIALVLSIFYMLRFSNRIMAIVAYIAFMGVLFFTCSQISGIVKAIVPFVIMIASALVYFLAKYIAENQAARHYLTCLAMLEIASLLGFYIGGNYFVVRELSNVMFNLQLQEGASIPFAKLFWGFTILTPVLYVAMGLKRKDSILLRTGLVVIAASILTIRQYYYAIDLEIVMAVAGIAFIILAAAVIRYLKTPKYGFTYHPVKDADQSGSLQLESLIIAETFSVPDNQQPGTQYGGGNFGGGGAGSEF
ncbi:MAG: hypothetical protein V4717_00580 [Bacteroidota bacterium]